MAGMTEQAQARSPEQLRALLVGAAVAEMNLLATLAEGEELRDLKASFLGAASVWAQDSSVAAVRLLPLP